MEKKKIYNFTVVIEKDEDGYYVGYVPSIKGCHTQGKTIDELMKNIKEAIELCLEVYLSQMLPFIILFLSQPVFGERAFT
ncbi:type II toxin-antitoxin system HicB family antitoxin [Candidatus Woesearchaeota archaeon]|nr:type II toxin-antitoxin system HicB family antitoxin [Candidatus Woesearchaeota archaeon]